MGQLRMSKYSGDVPVMLVVQFWSSLTMAALERSDGAAALMLSRSVRMAARSSHVSVGIDPNPPRTPPELVEPDCRMRMFVPMAAKACSTWALAPAPMAIMAMTAPTPMTMPNVVRNARSLLRKMARKATRKVCTGFKGALLPFEPAPPAWPLGFGRTRRVRRA